MSPQSNSEPACQSASPRCSRPARTPGSDHLHHINNNGNNGSINYDDDDADDNIDRSACCGSPRSKSAHQLLHLALVQRKHQDRATSTIVLNNNNNGIYIKTVIMMMIIMDKLTVCHFVQTQCEGINEPVHLILAHGQ